MSKDKILVVEDAPDISSLLKIYFSREGFEVMTAMRGQVALEMCRKTPPNLALLDVNLPDMEGYDIGKVLRSSARTRHIPIIFLTARGEKGDRIRGLGEVQAEYYIVKPFDIEEVHTIVKGALDRARQKNLAHPVTNLPTAELINDQYRRLVSSSGWALAQAHINGFETFSQVYGAVVGEDVLKFTALMLNEVVNELGSQEDFIGQMVVGPDFVITSSVEHLKAIGAKLCERFDAEIGRQYNYKDRRNGYIVVHDEQGNPKQEPLMSLSIGVLTSDDGPFYDIRELSETVEAARQQALAEAREQGRKSHVGYGRDGGWGGPYIPQPPPAPAVPIKESELEQRNEEYEKARKLRDLCLEYVKARRGAGRHQIRREVDHLLENLNHDLGYSFTAFSDRYEKLGKSKITNKPARQMFEWIKHQYQLGMIWHRSMIECGIGYSLQREPLNLGPWVLEQLCLLRDQLELPIEIDSAGMNLSYPLEVDPSTLQVACLHLLIAANAAGATHLHMSIAPAELHHGLMLIFEDQGETRKRLQVLRAAPNATSFVTDPWEYQGLGLLWRMLYLQDITVSFQRQPPNFQISWSISDREPTALPVIMSPASIEQFTVRLREEIAQLEAEIDTPDESTTDADNNAARDLLRPYSERLEQYLHILQVRVEDLIARPSVAEKPARDLWLMASYSHLLARNLSLTLAPRFLPAEPTNLNRQIRDVCQMLGYKLSNNVDVRLDLPPQIPPAAIAAIDGATLLLNILKNAAETMGKGGMLRVTTAHHDNMIVVRIKDTGDGIATEKQEQIFATSYSTRGKKDGVGLGLSVAQMILRHVGGVMRIASLAFNEQQVIDSWHTGFEEAEQLSTIGTLVQIEIPEWKEQ